LFIERSLKNSDSLFYFRKV